MNKAVLIGRLTRDPETRTTTSGLVNTNFTLAVDRRAKSQDGKREADFIPVVTWRQTAELCAKYLQKGRQVAVFGRIQTRSYDAQDGTKRYVTEVVADEVQFLGSKDGQQDAPPPEPHAGNDNSGGFTEVDDDELPF